MKLLEELRAIAQPRNVTERNFRNVLVDGIGVGIVVGVGTFLAVFLARLGASSLLVGLLTSLPALTGALLGVPIGQFLERQRNIVIWYSRSRVWVLWSYALFGFLPFLLPLNLVPWAVIAIWAVVTVPSTIVNVAFTVVMGQVAGPRHRFRLMSLRWSSLGTFSALSVALAGQILDRMVFPLNYQVVFIGSFFGGLLSFLFSRSLTIPDQVPVVATADPEARLGVVRWFTDLVAVTREAPAPFLRFTASSFVFRSGVAMGMPLLPLYWVRVVEASDAAIGLITLANSAVLLVAYAIWSATTRRVGVGKALLVSSLGIALYPLAVAATTEIWILALLAGLVGFFVAGNDLVNFDLLLSSIPTDHQAMLVGFYQTLQNSALFIMPLVGTLLADQIGLTGALVIAGLLRLMGSGLFFTLGIGRRPVALGEAE
jgi:hypothetical protein